MNIDNIQKFLDAKSSTEHEYVKISFRHREAINGLFVKEHKDYSELKKKNFWRIVPQSQFEIYHKSGDIQLARIFNGADFTRLKILDKNV